MIFEASSVIRASLEKFFATTLVLEEAATNHPTDPGTCTAPVGNHSNDNTMIMIMKKGVNSG